MEKYTPGYTKNATNFMENRTAQTHAAFFLPSLKAGMNLLDCGCGPGSITAGFATLVNPGTVIGIDLEISQVQTAQNLAKEQSIKNLKFQAGSTYNLPFNNESFDAVFSHAMLEHLQEPQKVLQEIWRVLKPGGVIGLRTPDWGGFLITPAHPELEQAISYYKMVQQKNGGNPYIGRHLGTFLKQAGFTQIQATASYECYQNLSVIAEYLALRIESSEKIDQAIEQNWTDAKTLKKMSQALREWSQHSEGMFAQAWCEAVAYKPA